ncbi:MAG: hypothetical protein RL263_1508, partial [Bacteroidota bacterium]
MKTQVVIIGAGPTGLMLANQLKRFDIDFLILDTKTGPTNQSRALAVSARSMELYQQLGLAELVSEESTEVKGFEIFQNGKAKASVNLENLGKGLSDFPNFMNAFEQSKNENLLAKHLQQNGQEILWNHEFLSFEERSDTVIVSVKNLTSGELITIEASYLVGCEGARSPIRHQLNLSFDGGTYENKFFVVDTKIDWDLPYDKVILAPSDFQFITFFPLKGNRNMRVIGTLPRSFNDQEDIDIEKLEKIIQEVTKIKIDFIERGWNSIYKLHHRSVKQFSKGRVFLAGDAAHIHSPAGGQGMNTGLQDAHNLAWKLAFVLKKFASDKLLDTYNEERLPIANQLLKSTDGGFTYLAGDQFFIRTVRKLLLIPIISRLLRIDKFRTFAFKKISQIDYSYDQQSLSKSYTQQKLTFKAGDRLPFIEDQFYNKFKAPSFHLICIT